jgi:hypothetical protein
MRMPSLFPAPDANAPVWPNHAQILNRLGNLTLLGKRLNMSIKNADFATKKRDGYADSDILMTSELLDLDAWDTAAIETRQRELSEWVFGIWKFPEEVAPADVARQVVEQEATGEPDTAALDQLPEVPG